MQLYYIENRNGAFARGYEKGKKFVVLLGSQCLRFVRNRDGKKIMGGKTGEMIKFSVSEDAEFDSPTAAAKFVVGRSTANGLDEWKDKNGKTLKENQALQHVAA